MAAATITDRMVMQEIQYCMIETPDLGQTWDSGLWSKAEVVGYMNQRQQRFLKATHFQVGIANIEVDGTTTLIDLPDDWIDTVRVLWSTETTTSSTTEGTGGSQNRRMSLIGFLGVDIGRLRPAPDGNIGAADRLALLPLITTGGSDDTTVVTHTGVIVELPRSDSWEADHGIPTWPTVSGRPKLYYDSGGTTLTMRIAPLPDSAGTIIIYYVPYAAVLDATGEVITLPNEFVPTLKYGVMADMFSKVGRGQDLNRAAYCLQRYDMGIEIANMLLKGWQ